MRKFNRTIFLVVIIFVFFFLLGGRKLFQPYQETQIEYQYLSLFSEVAALVKTGYVEEIDVCKKFPGAFSSMVSSLDPFSAYLDKQRTDVYKAYRSGRVFGCGIFGTKVTNYFYITDVAPGSPAEKAGLKPGDRIKSVNGESIFARAFWEMYLSLLSPTAQPIEVVLFKANDQNPKKLKMQREPVQCEATIERVNPDMLLVKLPCFTPKSAALLSKSLKEQSKPLKLIIDLRQYHDGDLNSFIEISKLFFTGRIPLTLKSKEKKDVFLLGSPDALEYEAAVIVNPSTRMYGELLAALFKKKGNDPRCSASLIGTSTKGFVSNLETISLEDGSSLLLTTGLFLLDGVPMASKSIKPDHTVDLKDCDKITAECISILKKGKKEIKDIKKVAPAKTATNG